MDIITMTPTAALRSRSESSFVVPSAYVPTVMPLATASDWHLGMNVRTPMNDHGVRNTRTVAKQAAPPRGEPR